jgi:cell division protein FtsZ
MRFELEDEKRLTVLRVVGIGGAGGNAVNRMVGSDFKGVDFVAVNTDLQVLRESRAYEKIQIGEDLTRGLGSGGDAKIGRQSAEESLEILRSSVQGADMVYIAAGMGGGTGTGASPIVAHVARECGALTVGIVTKPFSFEGTPRMRQADLGIEELEDAVDTLIVIPNDKLLETADDNTTMLDAFAQADEVLCNATRGISDLITETGVVNLDFADVRSVMKNGGNAIMGIGVSSGENAAEEAARQAIASPLLDDVSIRGANGILVNVTGSRALGIKQISKAASVINSEAGTDAHVFLGTVIKESMPDDEVRITVIATGFERAQSLQIAGLSQVRESQSTIAPVEKTAFRPVPARDPEPPEPLPQPEYRPRPAVLMSMNQSPSAGPTQRDVPVHENQPSLGMPGPPVMEVPKGTQPVPQVPSAGPSRSPQTRPMSRGRSPDDVAEINFAELLERDQTVIELASQTLAESPRRDEMPDDQSDDDETIIMDNGSIRSCNSDKFRVPTFVRKQID